MFLMFGFLFHVYQTVFFTSFSRCTPRPLPSRPAGSWSSPRAGSSAAPPPRCPGASGCAWEIVRWCFGNRLQSLWSKRIMNKQVRRGALSAHQTNCYVERMDGHTDRLTKVSVEVASWLINTVFFKPTWNCVTSRVLLAIPSSCHVLFAHVHRVYTIQNKLSSTWSWACSSAWRTSTAWRAAWGRPDTSRGSAAAASSSPRPRLSLNCPHSEIN